MTGTSARAPLKLSVFGATGGTGRELTARATARNYEVRGLSRSAEKPPTDEAVTTVEGNVLDPAAAAAAVDGVDAVVCLLGRTSDNPDDVVSRGTPNIVDAMYDHGVERLVVLTSMGLGTSSRQIPWYVGVANATVLHELMADKARQEEPVAGSGLDWTIDRPGGLTDGPHTGEYGHGVAVHAAAGPTGPISRANVADFLLRLVKAEAYVRATPAVTPPEDADAGFLWDQAAAVTRRVVGE